MVCIYENFDLNNIINIYKFIEEKFIYNDILIYYE